MNNTTLKTELDILKSIGSKKVNAFDFMYLLDQSQTVNVTLKDGTKKEMTLGEALEIEYSTFDGICIDELIEVLKKQKIDEKK